MWYTVNIQTYVCIHNTIYQLVDRQSKDIFTWQAQEANIIHNDPYTYIHPYKDTNMHSVYLHTYICVCNNNQSVKIWRVSIYTGKHFYIPTSDLAGGLQLQQLTQLNELAKKKKNGRNKKKATWYSTRMSWHATTCNTLASAHKSEYIHTCTVYKNMCIYTH